MKKIEIKASIPTASRVLLQSRAGELATRSAIFFQLSSTAVSSTMVSSISTAVPLSSPPLCEQKNETYEYAVSSIKYQYCRAAVESTPP